MAIRRDKSSDKGPKNRIQKILPLTGKVFKDSLEETLQRLSNEKDRADQKTRECKKALVIALQTLQRLEQEEEQKITFLNKEKNIDFFPQWRPQQGVLREREEEEVPKLDDRGVETEDLIRGYQRNSKPTLSTKRLLEF